MMSRRFLLKWGFVPTILLAFGCSTQPKKVFKSETVQVGIWSSTLRVKDLRNDRGQSLDVMVIGDRNGKLRLTASAIMNIPVATLLLKDGKFYCALYPKRKFYRGKASPAVMDALVHMPISPLLLHNLVFEIPPREKGWVCQFNSASDVEKCESPEQKMHITWNRVEKGRRITIQGPGFDAMWSFNPPQTEVQLKQGAFDLVPSEGDQIIEL